MTRDDVEMLVENLQGVFEDKDGLRIMLEHLVHEAMGAEVTNHLNARRHARSASRRGYRNGTKPRKLKTRVGELDLAVPQTRNCEPYHPSLYAKWQRSERALLTACAEMYLQGVSTRRVQNVLQEMCGLELSAMSVSRIAAELDEKLTTFRNRPLVGQTYRYVMVDARYENIRVDGQVVSQAVMIVCGFNDEGGREILDWRIGDSESEATWGALFADMKKRGLSGVALVISDAHEGIVSALRRHFQGGRWQRCKVHFMREAAKKVAYKVRGELLSDLRLIFKGGDLASCLRVRDEVIEKWSTRNEQIANMLRAGLEDCLTYLDFPEEHRRRLSSTNMLERLMQTIKKRTRVVGVFPNRPSCDRLLGAILLETDEKWRLEERAYFSMSTAPIKSALSR